MTSSAEGPERLSGRALSEKLAAGEVAEGEVPEAVPAATVILVRDGRDGIETLLGRRDSKLAFAGGMWVFPGGRVDPDDYADGGTDDVPAAARAAAVRETDEEVGLRISADDLVEFSHWTPPPVAIKRYATWFYLAAAPEGAVSIDDIEIRDHRWARPADALRLRDEGEIELAPPTWLSLDRLGRANDVAGALAEAAVHPFEHFVTHIAPADGGGVALWHGDAGYDTSDPDVPGDRHRLWMLESGWRYERTTFP